MDVMGGYVVFPPSAVIDSSAHGFCPSSGQHSVYSATNSFSHYQYSVQAPYGQVGHDATIPTQSAYTPLTTQATAPYPVDPSLIASLSHFPLLWDVRARGPASLAS